MKFYILKIYGTSNQIAWFEQSEHVFLCDFIAIDCITFGIQFWQTLTSFDCLIQFINDGVVDKFDLIVILI